MNDTVPVLAILIPIIAILGGIGMALVVFRHKNKQLELEHQERMAAIEKGIPLPQAASSPGPQPQVVLPSGRSRNPYLWGFILGGAGLALVIGKLIEGNDDLGFALVLLFIGLAILAANLLFVRDHRSQL